MSRLATALALAVAALATVSGASAGSGPTFTVVASAPAALPSAEVPNAPGAILLPPGFTSPPSAPRFVSFPALQAFWQRAGGAYGIPWQVLAAINKIESNFGRNMGPSSAGAIGWMQFLPSTWLRWGMDASGDGVADPWDAEDAVYAAARYLAAAGARTDLARGIFAYNHAQWYVEDVLRLAGLYGTGGPVVTFALDRLQIRLEEAERAVTAATTALVAAVRPERLLRRAERALAARARRSPLLSDRLAAEKRAVLTGVRGDAAHALVARRKRKLAEAEAALAAARNSSRSSAFAAGALLGAPMYAGEYVFPVAGGPGSVTVSYSHHDYPAADIAAPEGSPLYALTHGLVVRSWHLPEGRCGIGFVLRAGDGREWTYCHLAYLEPAVADGVALSAGAPIGLVGSTGHSTGPHLHLQLDPPVSYPQDEPWFQGFAGSAFTWEEERSLRGPVFAPAGPVFAVVGEAEEPEVIAFSLQRA